MMGPNLIDMAKSSIDSDAVRKASEHLGENPERTQGALNAAIPTVMAGFARQASSDPTGESVTRVLSEARHGETAQDLPSKMTGGARTDALIAKSQGILGGLFGDRLPAAVDHVAASSGVSRGAAGSILAMAVPLVMGVVGREASSRKLGPAGMASMLIGQKGAIGSALGGGGLTSIFGTGADWAKPGAATRGIAGAERVAPVERLGDRTRHEVVTPEGKPMGRRIGMPLILLGALALLALLMLFRRGAPRVSAPELPTRPEMGQPRAPRTETPPAPVVQAPAPRGPATPQTPAAPTADESPTAGAPPAIGGGPSAAAAALNQFFGDASESTPKRIPLEGISFARGSSQLSPSQVRSLDAVAQPLRDHPTTKVRIDAFTDDQGDPGYNEKLSADRANAVRDALIRKGVNPAQLTISGRAIAPNDTDDGRASNRRVDLVILER